MDGSITSITVSEVKADNLLYKSISFDYEHDMIRLWNLGDIVLEGAEHIHIWYLAIFDKRAASKMGGGRDWHIAIISKQQPHSKMTLGTENEQIPQ